MSLTAYLIFFIILFISQLTFVPLFSIKNFTPDVLLIGVISFALQQGQFRAIIVGFLVGLFYDYFGTNLIGLSALSKALAGFVAGFWVKEHIEKKFGLYLALVFFTIILHDIVFYGILSISTNLSFLQTFFKVVIPGSIYTFFILILLHLTWPRLIWGTKTRFE
ncbi:MAG: rod shape-determining protein MreD [Calditrichaeota bacterium]|nr:MAG: rod shape-determining protein MreD [Calditrichota bacterium]